jgi:uncharacterized protein (TIGR03437 family)
MLTRIPWLLRFFPLMAIAAFGQSLAVTGMGYVLPGPTFAAPGQILTVYVSGVGENLTDKITASYPLPTTLAGFSVSVRQGEAPAGPFAAPLIAALPVRMCLSQTSDTCTQQIGIVFQFPYEVAPNIPGAGVVPNTVRLTVADQSGASASMDLDPVPDQIHVIRLGDSIAFGTNATDPAVTHADGSLVTAQAPAIPGETLTAYATGLGATDPSVPTGGMSPTPPAKANAPFAINFDFTPNARPSPGLVVIGPSTGAPSAAPPPAPTFAGLSPGSIGLYQLNFTVPSPPNGTQACGAPVWSNLTVTFVGPDSYDGARLCVKP